MCRNIRVLHSFEPPTTREEMRAAAIQYVRKVSGMPKPSRLEQAVFDQAVDQIAATTEQLLGALHPRIPLRTRDGEKQKARARWQKREAGLRSA